MKVSRRLNIEVIVTYFCRLDIFSMLFCVVNIIVWFSYFIRKGGHLSDSTI